jgi:hypothetical protein
MTERRSYRPPVRAAWSVFALTLPLYWLAMNRTIGFIDRGELAATAVTFGIPHPTGYPTLMLIAGAATRLVPLRPVLVLNALVGVFVATGAAVLVLLLDRVLFEIAASTPPRTRATCALLAALFTALTTTWWQQANGFEVYALHALLMPLVVLLFLRWSDTADAGDASAATARRAGRTFAFVTGLAFTNHLTTILLAPALLTCAVLRFGRGRELARRVLPLAPAFLLGLAPYAWLPIRASMRPRFNWGHIDSVRAFLHHVSGADYQRWMFADASKMSLQLRYLLWRVPLEFAVVGLLVAGLGAALLVRRAPRLAVLAFGLVITGALFASGYGIPDLDAYLLTTVLGVALCFAAGLLRLHERFGMPAALALGAALVLVNGALHFEECDERDNRMVEGFVHDVVGALPPRSVLFTDMWENLEAGFYYFKDVEGFRRDVVIVSPVLAHKGWYLDELEQRAPDLVARAGDAFRDYRQALRVVERGGPGSLPRLEAGRLAFIDAFVAGCMTDRPVFSTGAVQRFRRDWHPVPWRLAVWIRPDTAYVTEAPSPLEFRAWRGHMDIYAAQTYQAYAEARLARARYEARHGRMASARRLIGDARSFDPHIRPERVGPQPLGFDRYVLMTARFFRDLQAAEPDSLLRGSGVVPESQREDRPDGTGSSWSDLQRQSRERFLLRRVGVEQQRQLGDDEDVIELLVQVAQDHATFAVDVARPAPREHPECSRVHHADVTEIDQQAAIALLQQIPDRLLEFLGLVSAHEPAVRRQYGDVVDHADLHGSTS